jgi:hypothetical protein
MPDAATDALTRRIDRLEREARTWRIMASTLLAIVFLVAASPQSPIADQLVAREFILVDDLGNRRAMLRIGPDGPNLLLANPDRSGAMFSSSALVLFDKNRNPRAQMDIADGVPTLALRDAHGKTRAGLLVDPSMSPRLSLFDSGLAGAITIGYMPTGERPFMALVDKDGKTLWTAP